MIDIKDLEAFIAIMDGGSISQAAHALGLTQPAISLKLKKMEQELNIQLFQRTPRSMIPMDAARSIEAKVRDLIANFDSIKDELAHSIEEIKGTVRIGCILGWSSSLMIPVVSQVMRNAPNIKFRMCVEQTANLMNMLMHGQIDLAVVAEPFELTEGIEAHPLLIEDLVIAGCNLPKDTNEDSYREQLISRSWVTLAMPDLLVEKYWKIRFPKDSFPWNRVNVSASIDHINSLPEVLIQLKDAVAVLPKQVLLPYSDSIQMDHSHAQRNELFLACRVGCLKLKRFDMVRQTLESYIKEHFP